MKYSVRKKIQHKKLKETKKRLILTIQNVSSLNNPQKVAKSSKTNQSINTNIHKPIK